MAKPAKPKRVDRLGAPVADLHISVPGEPDGANMQPVVKCYPKCATCEVPYVLRLAHTMTVTGRWTHEWVWQRDCKHKGKDPIPVMMETT